MTVHQLVTSSRSSTASVVPAVAGAPGERSPQPPVQVWPLESRNHRRPRFARHARSA